MHGFWFLSSVPFQAAGLSSSVRPSVWETGTRSSRGSVSLPTRYLVPDRFSSWVRPRSRRGLSHNQRWQTVVARFMLSYPPLKDSNTLCRCSVTHFLPSTSLFQRRGSHSHSAFFTNDKHTYFDINSIEIRYRSYFLFTYTFCYIDFWSDRGCNYSRMWTDLSLDLIE